MLLIVQPMFKEKEEKQKSLGIKKKRKNLLVPSGGISGLLLLPKLCSVIGARFLISSGHPFLASSCNKPPEFSYFGLKKR